MKNSYSKEQIQLISTLRSSVKEIINSSDESIFRKSILCEYIDKCYSLAELRSYIESQSIDTIYEELRIAGATRAQEAYTQESVVAKAFEKRLEAQTEKYEAHVCDGSDMLARILNGDNITQEQLLQSIAGNIDDEFTEEDYLELELQEQRNTGNALYEDLADEESEEQALLGSDEAEEVYDEAEEVYEDMADEDESIYETNEALEVEESSIYDFDESEEESNDSMYGEEDNIYDFDGSEDEEDSASDSEEDSMYDFDDAEETEDDSTYDIDEALALYADCEDDGADTSEIYEDEADAEEESIYDFEDSEIDEDLSVYDEASLYEDIEEEEEDDAVYISDESLDEDIYADLDEDLEACDDTDSLYADLDESEEESDSTYISDEAEEEDIYADLEDDLADVSEDEGLYADLDAEEEESYAEDNDESAIYDFEEDVETTDLSNVMDIKAADIVSNSNIHVVETPKQKNVEHKPETVYRTSAIDKGLGWLGKLGNKPKK